MDSLEDLHGEIFGTLFYNSDVVLVYRGGTAPQTNFVTYEKSTKAIPNI